MFKTDTVRCRVIGAGVSVPPRAVPGGFILQASTMEPLVLMPDTRLALSVGVSIDVPRGYEASIRPHPRLATNEGVTVEGAPVTLGLGQHLLRVTLINRGPQAVKIRSGDPVGLLLVRNASVVRLAWEV